MSTHGRFGLVTGLAVAALMLGTLAVGVTYAQQQQGGRGRGAGRGAGMMGGPGMRGPGMMGGGPMGMLRFGLRQLDLTDAQKQQVKTILSNHQSDFTALRDRMRPAHVALADAVASGDEAAIRQRSGELSAVQTDAALLAAKVKAEIYAVLTPEQRQKADQLRQQFEQRMGQPRAKRHDNGI